VTPGWAGFVAVLVLIFMPLFDGRNALNYMDDLYNSISKGSAYYIGGLQEEVRAAEAAPIETAVSLESEAMASQASALFETAGVLQSMEGARLDVQGDLNAVLLAALEDSDRMFANAGDFVQAKYGMPEKEALFLWWQALKGLEKSLSKQKEFAKAKIVSTVTQKAVETAYNYYGIDPQKISDRLGIVIFSLVFYVIYTLWYGFAILFLFEGWGLRLSH